MLEKNNAIKYYPINKFTNVFFNEPKDKYPICLIKHCVCTFDLRMITANFIKQLHVISELSYFYVQKRCNMNE